MVADKNTGDVDDAVEEEDGGEDVWGEASASSFCRALSSKSILSSLVIWSNPITMWSTRAGSGGGGWNQWRLSLDCTYLAMLEHLKRH